MECDNSENESSATTTNFHSEGSTANDDYNSPTRSLPNLKPVVSNNKNKEVEMSNDVEFPTTSNDRDTCLGCEPEANANSSITLKNEHSVKIPTSKNSLEMGEENISEPSPSIDSEDINSERHAHKRKKRKKPPFDVIPLRIKLQDTNDEREQTTSSSTSKDSDDDIDDIAGASSNNNVVSAESSNSSTNKVKKDESVVNVSAGGVVSISDDDDVEIGDSSDDDIDEAEESTTETRRLRKRLKKPSETSQNGDQAAKAEMELMLSDLVSASRPATSFRVLDSLMWRECGMMQREAKSISSRLFNDKTMLQEAEQCFMLQCSGGLSFVQRLHVFQQLDGHEGCVNALHFNSTGSLLASSSDDLSVIVWDWYRGRQWVAYDSGHRSNVFQAKFLPFSNDSHIVSCARDGQVRLAQLSSTGRCLNTKKLASHKGAAHKLSLEEDSPHVFLSCGEDSLVYQIDLREEKPRKLVVVKDEAARKIPLYTIHSRPTNANEFAIAGRDKYIRMFDKRKMMEGNSMKKFCPHRLMADEMRANITCLMYSYNGSEIIASYNDDDIYLFDTSHSDGADYINRYTGHRNNATVKGVNFYGPRSDYIVSGSDCGNVFLWEKKSAKVVNFMHGDDSGVVNVLEPHPHYPCLATSGLDHNVKVWLPTSDKEPSLSGLNKVIARNKTDRERERSSDAEFIDGHMLWFLMRTLRRQHRQRTHRSASHAGGDAANDDNSPNESDENDDLDRDDSSSDISDDDSDDDDNNEDEDDSAAAARIQCPLS